MRASRMGLGLWSAALTTNRVHKVRRTKAFRRFVATHLRRPYTEGVEVRVSRFPGLVNRGVSLTRFTESNINPLAIAYLSGRNSAVECQLPKLDVTGSIPVARSNPLVRGSF